MPHAKHPAELKRNLKRQGFEIYRTLPDRVVLAERVRDNLIMDSGVAVAGGESLGLHVVVRAQASHFPGASEAEITAQVTDLARPFVDRGYSEAGVEERLLSDPSHPERVLDRSYEIALYLAFEELEPLLKELAEALALPRSTGDD